MKGLFRSLSFRLAVNYAVLFGASVAVLLALFYWVSVRSPLETVEDAVEHEAAVLAQSYMLDGAEVVADRLQVRARSIQGRKPFHALIDAQGEIITANLPSWPEFAGNKWLRIEADIYQDGDEQDHEALVFDRRFDDGARLLVGRDIEDVDEIEEQLAAVASWMILGTLALAILGGAQMSRAIGSRVEGITTAARTVIAGDLSGRVALRGSGDDFDRLGETLNVMLNRIEELVDSVRRVSDTIAHELRTPLSRLLADLREVAEEQTPDRRDVLIQEAVAETERLQHLFDALLRIARIESGRHAIRREHVDLASLANDAVELHQPSAEEKGMALSLGQVENITVSGDRDLLFQALSNLIDNALKHSGAGSAVQISVAARGDRVVLAVSDDGEGVSDTDRAHLAERFYRGRSAIEKPGEGLGLSVVAAIIEQHGGELRFRDSRPGLTVEITLTQSLQNE